MKTRHAMLLSALLSLAPGPHAALAYHVLTTSTGQEVRWYQPVVYYYINPEGFEDFAQEEMIRLTTQCFETWMDTQVGPTFLYAGTIDVKTPSDDCFNVIFFVQDPMEWMEMFQLEDGTAMAMTRTYVDAGGGILGFDLGLNDAGYTFTNTDDPAEIMTDYANTLTHEIGHVLGLDHSEDPDAVMYPTAPTGEISKRTLADDDREGMRYLYRDPMPDSGYGCNAPQDPRCADTASACDVSARNAATAHGSSSIFLWALPFVSMRLRRNRLPDSRGWRERCKIGTG